MDIAVMHALTDAKALTAYIGRTEALVYAAMAVVEQRHVDSLQDAITDLHDVLTGEWDR